ncbi:MAG TPA: mandelate racemase/muconate lactonizing enzyme family protein [Burkholderiales bacterium]|nr:mandelate racemase/muconate lactonizing enzyme family protein [Burkholderiales bacterium]
MRRAAAVVADIVNNNLAPIVVGANALEVEDIWQKVYTKQAQTHGPGWSLYKALSGVDMALWDVRGKALGQPVYRLLGGSRKKIRAYAGGVCLGFQPPPRLLEEAQSFVAKGYTALKLRLGDSVERDVERVRHVRAALGDKIDIMVDVNTRYSFLDLQRALPALEECRVFWLEEPFTPDSVADYTYFNQRTLIPLAGGENHFTRFEARELLEARAVDIIQPDPCKAGGITECKKIADLASAFKRPFAPHTGMSAIDATACVHLLCAASNALIYEGDCAAYNPFRDELCRGAAQVVDGYIEPSDAPGLGLEVDESLFTRFPGIPGPCYI